MLQLASRVVERLKLLDLKINDEDEKIFGIAAFLHDIGCAPFFRVSKKTWEFSKRG